MFNEGQYRQLSNVTVIISICLYQKQLLPINSNSCTKEKIPHLKRFATESAWPELNQVLNSLSSEESEAAITICELSDLLVSSEMTNKCADEKLDLICKALDANVEESYRQDSLLEKFKTLLACIQLADLSEEAIQSFSNADTALSRHISCV